MLRRLNVLYVNLFYVIITHIELSIIINIIETMKAICVINAFGADAGGRLVRIVLLLKIKYI